MRARSCRSMALNVRNVRTRIAPAKACSRTNSDRGRLEAAARPSIADKLVGAHARRDKLCAPVEIELSRPAAFAEVRRFVSHCASSPVAGFQGVPP